MKNDQLKKNISVSVTRLVLSPFSKSTYSTIAAIIILCVYTIMIVPNVHAQDAPAPNPEQADTTNSFDPVDEVKVSNIGMGVASALATIVYFPVKSVFALVGGVVGGLTYAFTGGDEEATQRVWQTSMDGTYNISPENLTGEKPVHFLGPTE